MTILHVGDVGVVIRLTVQEDGSAKDISTATTKQIKIRKPSGEIVTLTGSFTTTGSDGKLEAETTSTDFDELGEYRAYAYLVIGDWSGHTGSTRIDCRAVGE
ncbi:MAG: hypothetical protein AB7J46_06400 [Candidatus Altimarinota bacterium]